MLDMMRKHQKSFIIKLMFILIILSFVIGFVFIIMGRDELGQMGPTDYAVKVNGTEIGFQELEQSYDRIRRMFGGTLTPEQEKMLGIKKLALDTLVDSALIQQEAEDMGIKVSKEEVIAEIEKIPAFQKDGAFNFEQYQLVLRSARTTPDAFEKSFREDLMIRKARKAMEEKVAVSDEEALQAYKKQHDRINLLFTAYSPAEVKGEVKLSRQELEEYLRQHEAEFKTPEQISISYVFIDPASLIGKLTVSEEEAQAYYQRNIDRYKGKNDISPYEQVKERVKADALKLKAVKQAYEVAAEAINKNAQAGIEAAAKSAGASVTTTPLFTKSSVPRALAGEEEVIAKAFALRPQELAGPVETGRGVYILALKERKPSVTPPLDSIKAQVEQLATEAKAKELAKKRAEEDLAKFAKGESSNMRLQETGLFNYSATGDVPKIGKAPSIMEAAFSLSSSAPVPNAPIQVGPRWFALKLKNRVEGDMAGFAKAKEQIKQLLLPQKQKEEMEKRLADLRKQANIKYNPGLQID